jgi:hypothetical protein
MSNTLSSGEFIKKLSEGSLQTKLTTEGFAKPIEGNDNAFLFSIGESCENWTKIPSEIVEKVEIIGEQTCRDHSHPLVRIQFKESPTNDPHVAAFSSLLKVMSNKSNSAFDQLQNIAPASFRPPPFCHQAFVDCFYYHRPRACELYYDNCGKGL